MRGLNSRKPRSHRSFALVLAGGGARGFAHVGVLRALERYGFHPGALVGVSMGALVSATYALRADWYRALEGLNTNDWPGPQLPPPDEVISIQQKARRFFAYPRLMWELVHGWGVGTKALTVGHALLRSLTRGRNLEDGRIPVALGVTDLKSGRRVILRSGKASEAIYASVALAGILPPLQRGECLLADGAYADTAPIDVARNFENEVVIGVDPSQQLGSIRIANGLQALVRAVDICHMRHSDLRLAEADLVIRPEFRRIIDTLDFDSKRESIAAGIRGVRNSRRQLTELLCSGDGTTELGARGPDPISALGIPGKE